MQPGHSVAASNIYSLLYIEFVLFLQVSTRTEAHNELNNFRKKNDSTLIISGTSLEVS